MKSRKELLTRDQAIEKLFELVDVADWGAETQQMFIEDILLEQYQKLTDEQLTNEIANEWEIRYKIKDEDKCPYIVDESPTAQVLHGN